MLWKMVPVSLLYDDMCRNNNECRVFFVHDCTSCIFIFVRFHSIEHKICIFLISLVNCDNSSSYQVMFSKNISSSKISILHANDFVRFHAVESETELPQEFWKKRNNCVSYWAMYTQIVSLLFLTIYILYIIFRAISSTRN